MELLCYYAIMQYFKKYEHRTQARFDNIIEQKKEKVTKW